MHFEFFVEGPPVSQQARRRERVREWQNIVKQAAKQYWPENQEIVTEAVLLQITYFYEINTIDTDNIVKPIQDAIIGLVYVDDAQVTDVIVRKRDLSANFVNRDLTPALMDGFACGQEFLHIVVKDAPDPEVLIL